MPGFLGYLGFADGQTITNSMDWFKGKFTGKPHISHISWENR
jgi:hypothetical protein